MKIYIVTAFFILSLHSTAQLTIQNGATLHINTGEQLTLLDADLIDHGTLNAYGRIIFNGNANNQISGSAPIAINDLEIAKSGNNKLSLFS